MSGVRVFAGMLVALLAALPVGPGVAAAGPPPQAAREIDALIVALGRSGCQFQRNGSWYPAPQAQAHLQRKYDWLRERGLVDSAEQFIERAGARSSMSGRAYQVRCPGAPAVESADWLTTRLRALRGADPGH